MTARTGNAREGLATREGLAGAERLRLRRAIGEWAASLWPRPRSEYIVSPVYDWLLFLGQPVFALLVGILISGSGFADERIDFYDQELTRSQVAMGVLIHAHIVMVFFRSHGNPKIFPLYRVRFLLAPVALYTAMMASEWLLICVAVLVTFWDVYHSSLQTFGFGRIYAAKLGNPPTLGRRLDWWMNHLLYVGPILGGQTLMAHLDDLEYFEEVGTTFFSAVPIFMQGNQRYFSWAVLALGTAFTLYYVWAHWRFHRQGHRVSPLKVWLLASTGLVSIYTWGFNSWGEAFLIMNLFHAVQYFGIVWATERDNLSRLFGTRAAARSKPVTFCLFMIPPLVYGYWVEALDTDFHSLWALTLVASILHFWYDGFIWSVRRSQV